MERKMEHKVVAGRHEWVVRETMIHTPGVANTVRPGFEVAKRPINKKNGLPWQAERRVAFYEETEKCKAMRHWLKLVEDAKRNCA